VGHVKTGSLTRLKLEAWPFQKHGTLTGRLRTLSEDVFNPDPKKATAFTHLSRGIHKLYLDYQEHLRTELVLWRLAVNDKHGTFDRRR
jgi:hypothetical protein